MSVLELRLNAVAKLAAEGEMEQAREALSSLIKFSGTRLEPQHVRQLRQWQLKLAPWWWQPLRAGDVLLRRTQADDASFYEEAFRSDSFARRYNRQRAWSGDLQRALDQSGRKSPLDIGAVYWIVCRADGTRCGLASLTSISLGHSRAEFSIGFPRPSGPTRAAVATLLTYDLAYFKLGLNKLYTYVYADNDNALHNSVRVGLRIEGRLRQHFWLPPGEFVDVHALGLTRDQLLNDERLQRLAQRWLGQSWNNDGRSTGN